MKLTDFFEKTYCVNLDRRPDRWSESLDEFNKFNLTSIERVSAVDGKTTDIALSNCGKTEIPTHLN